MQGTIGQKKVDNLVVPQGASGTTNTERAATLVANGVKGNVQSEGFRNVTVKKGFAVAGSAQLENGLGSGRVLNSRVNGDVQFFSNEGAVAARGSTVGANLQANQNAGGGNRAGDKEDQCRAL